MHEDRKLPSINLSYLPYYYQLAIIPLEPFLYPFRISRNKDIATRESPYYQDLSLDLLTFTSIYYLDYLAYRQPTVLWGTTSISNNNFAV